jgi:adenosylhomocysteine nucleosidase
MPKNHLITLEMAVMSEAKPFVLGMGLKQTEERPFRVFENQKVALIISGIGKANAAMAAFSAIQKFNPEQIINMGSAGSNDEHHPMGQIYQIDKIIESDRMDLRSRQPAIHTPDIFSGLESASLSTMDVPAIDSETRQKIAKNASLSDMEGAAVAQACHLMGKKCRLFKLVTDTPCHTEETDIVKSIKRLRNALYDYFTDRVIKRIDAP